VGSITATLLLKGEGTDQPRGTMVSGSSSRRLGCASGFSTDPSRVPFMKVPVLSTPMTKVLGQDCLVLSMYSAKRARPGPSEGRAVPWLL